MEVNFPTFFKTCVYKVLFYICKSLKRRTLFFIDSGKAKNNASLKT